MLFITYKGKQFVFEEAEIPFLDMLRVRWSQQAPKRPSVPSDLGAGRLALEAKESEDSCTSEHRKVLPVRADHKIHEQSSTSEDEFGSHSLRGTIKKVLHKYAITMSTSDWTKIRDGSKEETFKKGHKVFIFGKKPDEPILYKVLDGDLEVLAESTAGDKKLQVVYRYKKGDIFGIESFLTNGQIVKSSVTVRVSSQTCTCQCVPIPYIFSLFVEDPAMAGRFYVFLCSAMVQRLARREEKEIEDQTKGRGELLRVRR
eukprot:TRINITY_DN4787_c0_g1_i4.p1 TRINITY_DN4787_c0_g1~~TRINITY_DN4787_c0_g1_i4.p1  ORF type:complete len:258 (-),score=49.13 TRINITY_DN4787_c0_g1_i4:9-782(-)